MGVWFSWADQREYLLEAKRRKINFSIDLLTHIDNTVFILFIYMLILTKYIFIHREFFPISFNRQILFLFFFFLKYSNVMLDRFESKELIRKKIIFNEQFH